MRPAHPFRSSATACVIASLLSLGGCRAHYLGSYGAPDGGEAGSAGAPSGAAGSGAGAAGAGIGGAGGAGTGGGGGSSIDASSGDADADARPDAPDDATGQGDPDAHLEGAADTGTTETSVVDGATDGPTICTGVSLPEPVANYTFDDCDDQRSSLRDTSRHMADANRVGGVRCAGGRSGVAVYFSGDDLTQNGYLTVPGPDVPTFSGALTVSVWLSVWDNRYANILGKWYLNDSFLLLTDGTDFVFSVARPDGEGGVGIPFQVRVPAVLYRWVHVVAVFDGASVALYTDGKLGGTSPVDPPGALQQTTRALQMGGLDATGSFFKGMMDEVRLYDVALDATQVRALDCGL